MKRSPAVADRFYPGSKSTLTKTVTELLNKHNPEKRQGALAVVSPHAGYIYSGEACAETLKAVEIPETVLILGPNHHGRGAPVSLSTMDWAMPMGTVSINHDLADSIMKYSPTVENDESAHQFEHSLEVQVPFLQALQKNLTIVPLALSHLRYGQCQKLADACSSGIKDFGKPVLIVASSDMSHYESRENATVKDNMALEKLTALQPAQLYSTVLDNQISMCGVIPVSVALQTAINLGANGADLICYTDSGAVTGDVDQVVGYAGAVIYQQ